MSKAPADASEVYLAVIDRLEPDLTAIDAPAAAASMAISLKRIAEAMEDQAIAQHRIADALEIISEADDGA